MLTRLTPIDGEAIFPLADIKWQAHITHAVEDATLAGFRNAALGHVERLSGFALAEAQFRWTVGRFDNLREFPRGPVVKVDALTYTNSGGLAQEYVGARVSGGRVEPLFGETWPASYGHVEVTFTAGPPPPDTLAILLVAASIRFQILNDRGNSDLKAIEGMQRAFSDTLNSVSQVMV